MARSKIRPFGNKKKARNKKERHAIRGKNGDQTIETWNACRSTDSEIRTGLPGDVMSIVRQAETTRAATGCEKAELCAPCARRQSIAPACNHAAQKKRGLVAAQPRAQKQ